MNWGVMGGEQLGWGAMDESWRKGPWTAEEDRLLIEYVRVHGEGRWNSVARVAGLRRNGKSCRLRWVNYLRPDLKRGQITPLEESIILELHARWGNRWSTIARSLPGRTDNEIKNYWRTHFKNKAKDSSTSNSEEKARTRLLKKQQFQQQQQQFNQISTKKIMPLAADSENRVWTLAQMRNETSTMCPSPIEDQGFSSTYPILSTEMCVPEAMNEENVLWDGLWNLEDIHVALMQQPVQ